MAFAVTLQALTFATVQVFGRSAKPPISRVDAKLALGEITIPVEIREAGEAPLTVEVRGQA